MTPEDGEENPEQPGGQPAGQQAEIAQLLAGGGLGIVHVNPPASPSVKFVFFLPRDIVRVARRLIRLGKKIVAHRQVVHLGAHKTAVGVFR